MPNRMADELGRTDFFIDRRKLRLVSHLEVLKPIYADHPKARRFNDWAKTTTAMIVPSLAVGVAGYFLFDWRLWVVPIGALLLVWMSGHFQYRSVEELARSSSSARRFLELEGVIVRLDGKMPDEDGSDDDGTSRS